MREDNYRDGPSGSLEVMTVTGMEPLRATIRVELQGWSNRESRSEDSSKDGASGSLRVTTVIGMGLLRTTMRRQLHG